METTPIGCRVLVVDDDPIVRRAVTILFARFGYPVASAEGGREAIARIENTPYGLVVSDDDSGAELIRSGISRTTPGSTATSSAEKAPTLADHGFPCPALFLAHPLDHLREGLQSPTQQVA